MRQSRSTASISATVCVRNAYLSPLLALHDRGETVAYEDLFSSYEAGKLVLNSMGKTMEKTDNTLLECLDELHNSQIEAYTQTAKHDIQSYVSRFTPPTPSDANCSSLSEYINKLLQIAKDDLGGWKITAEQLNEFLKDFRSKAEQAFHEIEEGISGDGEENVEVIEIDGDDDEEEGEQIEEENEDEEEEGEQHEEESTSDQKSSQQQHSQQQIQSQSVPVVKNIVTTPTTTKRVVSKNRHSNKALIKRKSISIPVSKKQQQVSNNEKRRRVSSVTRGNQRKRVGRSGKSILS